MAAPVAFAVIASAALGATAQAEDVRIGVSATGPLTGYVAKVSGTFFNTALGSTTDGLTSPVDGAVVGFEVAGASGASYALQVLRPQEGDYKVVGTSDTLTDGVPMSVFHVVPIRSGDTIGLEMAAGTHFGGIEIPGTATASITPAPQNGEVFEPSGHGMGHEIAFNALIQPAPEILGVSPRSGPYTGGTRVRIRGTDFAFVQGIHFGRIKASRYRIVSPNEIVATAPRNVRFPSEPITIFTVAGLSAGGEIANFHYEACRVPEVVGRRLAIATRLLRRSECSPGRIVRRGAAGADARVFRQGPRPGRILRAGSRVNLTLG